MGNRYFKIFLLLFLIVIFFYFVIRYAEKEEKKEFNKIELSSSNEITNYHNKKFLDTIVAVGLKNLQISNVKVWIYPLRPDLRGIINDKYVLRAHVRGINNFYYIWIDDMNKNEFIETLSHELLHIKQYHDKRLVYEDGSFVYWEGRKYDLYEIDYHQRPWEIEAFNKELTLKQMMLLDLY